MVGGTHSALFAFAWFRLKKGGLNHKPSSYHHTNVCKIADAMMYGKSISGSWKKAHGQRTRLVFVNLTRKNKNSFEMLYFAKSSRTTKIVQENDYSSNQPEQPPPEFWNFS